MKNIYFLILFEMIIITKVSAQYNVIQSIDFDSLGRTVYALTGHYDYSYVLRYDNGNLESWNITQMFSIPFTWISTTIDKAGNIWAYQKTKLLKFDGSSWSVFNIPTLPYGYFNYSHIKEDNHGNIWLSGDPEYTVFRFSPADTVWKSYLFDPPSPSYTDNNGIIFEGDSTLLCTTAGLLLIFNDSVSIVLDTANSSIPSQKLYSYYVDSKGNRWFGSIDKGLIKWINDTTFISYNTSNSSLPDNFVNAIDEDSKGVLWLATDRGFASFNGDSITSYSHFYGYSIPTLTVDKYDKVWMGTVFENPAKLLVFDGNSLNIITDVAEEQVQSKHFQLYQNYPNPFNSSTKLKWQSPVSSWQTLKVYDILGNEVATLVNEEKPAGRYEVDFQSSVGSLQLASGIYFYQLKAGSFVETKKMILLR